MFIGGTNDYFTKFNLFQIGIKDFAHIKIIAANIRILLNIDQVHSSRCISKPRSELNHEYLIRKSQSGPIARIFIQDFY